MKKFDIIGYTEIDFHSKKGVEHMFTFRVGSGSSDLSVAIPLMVKYFKATERKISDREKRTLVAQFSYYHSQNGIEDLQVAGCSIDGKEIRFVEIPEEFTSNMVGQILVLSTGWFYVEFAKVRDELLSKDLILEPYSEKQIVFKALPQFGIALNYLTAEKWDSRSRLLYPAIKKPRS